MLKTNIISEPVSPWQVRFDSATFQVSRLPPTRHSDADSRALNMSPAQRQVVPSGPHDLYINQVRGRLTPQESSWSDISSTSPLHSHLYIMMHFQLSFVAFAAALAISCVIAIPVNPIEMDLGYRASETSNSTTQSVMSTVVSSRYTFQKSLNAYSSRSVWPCFSYAHPYPAARGGFLIFCSDSH